MPVAELHLLIFVRPDSLADVNNVLRAVAADGGDLTDSGGDPITVALQAFDDPATPGATVGWGGSWKMDNATGSAFNKALAKLRPLRGTEADLLRSLQDLPAWGSQRWFVFDGTVLPFDGCAETLGLTMLRFPPRG